MTSLPLEITVRLEASLYPSDRKRPKIVVCHLLSFAKKRSKQANCRCAHGFFVWERKIYLLCNYEIESLFCHLFHHRCSRFDLPLFRPKMTYKMGTSAECAVVWWVLNFGFQKSSSLSRAAEISEWMKINPASPYNRTRQVLLLSRY